MDGALRDRGVACPGFERRARASGAARHGIGDTEVKAVHGEARYERMMETDPSISATWPQEITRVVFFCPRIPEMSGGAYATENLSQAFRDRGITVEHVSVWPGEDPVRFRTIDLFDSKELHTQPALRSKVRGLGSLIAGIARYLRKRFSRRRSRRLLENLLRTHGEETAFVFTDPLVVVDALRTGTDPRDARGVRIGQFHSSTEKLEHTLALKTLYDGFGQKIDAVTALAQEDADLIGGMIGCAAYGVGNPVQPTSRQSALGHRKAVALARLEEEKNLDAMIRIFARATAGGRHPGWTLSIYGEGTLHEALEEEIARSRAQDRIFLEGRTEDIESVYENADLNLLTCRWEGFGMTIIEAGRAGVPSISYDCTPGVRSLLQDGGGILVSPMTEERFLEQLEEAMDHPMELRAMGEKALATAGRFSPDALYQTWSGILAAQVAQRKDR